MITPQGQARPFASLPPGRSPSGIAFDGTGRFEHRLLVVAEFRGRTTVFAVGCDGGLSTVTAGAPAMEGGIVVAPATFGSFGGDLIAADEASGQVYAVDPSGKVITLVRSGLPPAATSAWSPPGSSRRERPPRIWLTASQPATGTRGITPSCGCPRRS